MIRRLRIWWRKREDDSRSRAENRHRFFYGDHILIPEPKRLLCVDCDDIIWYSNFSRIARGR